MHFHMMYVYLFLIEFNFEIFDYYTLYFFISSDLRFLSSMYHINQFFICEKIKK